MRAESENSQQIADRYEQMLLRSPQPGTAFDKVIEWYSAKGGGLEVLQGRWEKASGENARYGILQGLLAERLRTPDKARKFYRQAMETDPASAAKLLAVLETTEGNFPAAVEAYKKALSQDSLPAVSRMEIMRSLALLYRRSFDDKKAGEVWKDALARFPDDPYVLEEAGEAFLDAGDYEAARSAFTRLQEVSKRDPFRKVAATLRLARTAELEGKTDEAVKTYELALEETSGGSWINREVRARIEELFRRKDDLPGLLSYYERRTTAVPQDFVAIAAQADVLEDLGRGPESLDRLRAATKLAPDDLTLRLKLVRRLEAGGNLQEALTEARELAKSADARPEALVALGQLLWSDSTKNPAAREEAFTTWRRLAPPDSKDPARIAQLAEILSSKGETDAAIGEWKRIVALSPTASDARQKLAQFYIERGDKNAARDSLSGLVEGDLAKPENFLTLARIQTKLDWPEEAKTTIRTALKTFPSDYELLSFAWKQVLDANDKNAAEALLPEIWSATPNDFFAEDTLKRYVSFLETVGAEKETLDALASQSAPDELHTSLLFRLALSRRDSEVADKALQALKTKTSPIRLARASSDYAQTFGTQEEQIAALRAIATIDPRMAAESLKSAAKIQADSGKVDEALATISQLIDHSPADGSLYGLYADIATRSGRLDAATARLQDGVRYAEDPGSLRLQLAAFLQVQSRNAEAAKVLQEAFEAEQREGRRSEIFRRQIELAMQTGTQDALIASLRDKQSREQGGARYGTYLAEIFLLQGDFLTAREELAKSLGHNPDNPQAVAKLLDLADQGGDQAEGLRLAARIVELEPSRENRANYIVRLFNSGESSSGLEELDKARPEILKDPAEWNAALIALRRAGFTKEADALIGEIADTKATDVLILSEIAKLRLSQLDIAAAEKLLWRILETGNFAAALEAVLQSPPAPGQFFPSPYWARFQPLQQLSSEVQSSLQMMFLQYRGSYFSRAFRMGLPTSGRQAAPEQRAVVRSLLLLNQLARTTGREKDFLRQASGFLEKENLTPTARFMILTTINDQEALKALIASRAALEKADPEMDRMLLGSPIASPSESTKEDLEKIKARMEKADPEFAFQQALNKLQSGQLQNDQPDDKEKMKTLLAAIKPLLEHPGATPLGKLQLAAFAANAGDLELAGQLYNAVANSDSRKTSSPQTGAMLDSQLNATATLLLTKGILSKTKNAESGFEQFLKEAASSPRAGIPPMPVFYPGMGRTQNILAQESPELAVGDSEFPVAVFRRMFTIPFPSSDGEKITSWFAERAKSGKLDPYLIGLIYCDWLSGKKESAVKRIEAIHAANPTPRSAALLLEFYEKLKAYEKALAVIELAALQKSESPDIRTLRKIRLLRAAGKIPEAKDTAEKLARGRLSTDVREFLRNELSQLGVPTNQYPSLANNRFHRSSQDRSNPLRNQISKLIAEHKADEAERMAVMILQNPLPPADDYQATNVRQAMLDSLRSLKRLDNLEASLEARLTADPGDFDAAIRLLEIATLAGGRQPPKDRLSEIISTHPDRVGHMDYALQLLQRRSETKELTGNIIASLIRSDLLYKSGFQIQRINDLVSDPKIGLALAETVAALDDSALNRLFLPIRLSGQMSEAPFLNQMAEFCVQAGKMEPAIALLKRTQTSALLNLDTGLQSVMRLAELQLLTGDKAGASATMTSLFESTSVSQYGGIFNGRQNISNILLNMLMNRMPGQSASDQITRLAKIATETETLEIFLKTLDEQSGKSTGITPALLLKTSLGRPGIAEQWRKIALDQTIPLGFFNLQTLSPVIKSLSTQKDAAQLIPALLRRFSEQQYGMGSSSLACLSDTLPALARYDKDPSVKKHISLLISGAMRDPSASQYLVHDQSYTQALATLIDNGYFQEARTLLDFTKGARSGRTYGNESLFAIFETRLDAAEGRETNFQIVCLAEEQEKGQSRVHWETTPALPENPYDGERGGATWDTGSIPVPEKQRPVSLEIFAGPNPACLQFVAKTAKPGLTGSLPAKLPGNYGLLQARWTLPDGSKKSGRLAVYVRGENLTPNAGIPSSDDSGFQTEQPGPLGKKSAVKFDRLLPSSELRVPLGEIALDGSPQIIAITGWLQGSMPNGQLPQVEIECLRDNGSKEQNNFFLSQASPGQWRQFVKFLTIGTSLPDASPLPKEAQKLICRLMLRSNYGYNSQWQITGSWDGIGIFRFMPEDPKESVDSLLSRARKSNSSKDYASATSDLLAALRQNPRRALDQSGSNLFETFEKAGKLSDLYSFLSEPALYLPDPIHNGNPTMRNEELIGKLARGTFSENAPPSAKTWLNQIASASLSENMRVLIEAAILRAEGHPDKATPERVLAILGFSNGSLNQARVRQLWSSSSSPTFELLSLLDTPEKIGQAREILSKTAVSTPFLAASKTVAAWLLAPSDPSASLKLWVESLALRNSGENSISFNPDSDKAILSRIAASHESPGDVVAAAKSWATGYRSNAESQQRELVDALYALSKLDGKNKVFYATAWADAELAALRTPGYSASRDRIRELARRMLDAAEWDRLSTLLGLAGTDPSLNDGVKLSLASKGKQIRLTATNPSLNSQSIQREFAQLRDVVAFAQGDWSKAWPVTWCESGTNSRKVKISWQWNTKDIQPLAGLFDTAISVAAKPLIPEIAKQTGIEFLFGEIPGSLVAIAKADGNAATGSVEAELPSANGFLRAVALVDGKRIPGPLVPVVSGKRIFPDVPLKSFLLSGSQPIPANQLSDADTAPDGSPAVRIGIPGSRERWEFVGAEIPVQPEKFYVMRAWIRRAGQGTVCLSGEFKPIKTSKAGSLNMLLSEREEATAQWVLYTRAIPTLPQHTFWIPFREVESVVPRAWDIASGTEVAGWELLEINDWKYGKWLGEIAMLRESTGDPVDPLLLDKMLELAAFEPLTAIDYHGAWLVENIAKAGHPEKILPLYRSALEAEANPLFSRPKLGRIFVSLAALSDNPDVPEPVRWDAQELALANIDRVDHSRRLAFQRRHFLLAKDRGLEPEMLKTITEDLFQRIAEKEKGRDFIKSILTNKTYNVDLSTNEFLALMDSLADEATIRKFLAELDGDNGKSLDPHEIAFVRLALELCIPSTTVDPQWLERLDKAFQMTEKSNDPIDFMYWPALLGELMVAKKCDQKVILHLEQKSIGRLLSTDKNGDARQEELLRATAALVENCAATGNPAPVKEWLPKVLNDISSRKQNSREPSLRMSLRILDALHSMGEEATADTLLKLVESDVRKSPKLLASYSKYLPEENHQEKH